MKRIYLYLISVIIATGYATAQEVTEISIIPDNTIALDKLDNLPEYKGGQSALFKALSDNLIYPQECLEEHIQGTVLVQFIISHKGAIKDITVLNSIHPLLDKEAIRVVGLLKDWKPGIKDGKAVDVYYNLPISFKLQDDSLPDYSEFTYFELRDGLISYLKDLYRDVPSNEHNMTKANVINEYTSVKCVIHFSKLPDEFKSMTESDLLWFLREQFAKMLPYELRKALCDHDIKLIYEIFDDSTGKIYNVRINKTLWIPENDK